MKKMSLLLVLLCIVNICFAQTYKIPLTNKLGNRSIYNLVRTAYQVDNIAEYKGYDISKYVSWAIKQIQFSIDQGNVENFIKGTLSREGLMKMVNSSGRDTNLIMYKLIPENTIGIFIAIDHQNSKHVIVDADGDKDFGNDNQFVFKFGDISYPKLNIKIPYPDGENIKFKNLPFFIDVNPKHFKNNALGIALLEKSYKEGIFNTKDGTFFIDLDNETSFLYKGEPFFLSVMSSKDVLSDDIAFDIDSIRANEALLRNYNLVNSRYIYSNKDSIQIGKSLYKIDSLVDNTLHFKYVNEVGDNGEINTIAPNIKANDLLSKQPFELKKKRGNYVVIDFWGSWCAPCIEALPRLVEIHHKYKHKGLVILSIAMDKVKDVGKLELIINDKKLNWNHLFVDKNGPMEIIKSYKVQQYPTTLLIDRKGKVVIRNTGVKALDEIDLYLSKK